MTINKVFLDSLFEKAKESERLRMNYDLRTSEDDGSQRMLNALLPGTKVPIHRHPNSNENVLCLSGKLVEVLYEEDSCNRTAGHDPATGKTIYKNVLGKTQTEVKEKLKRAIEDSAKLDMSNRLFSRDYRFI